MLGAYQLDPSLKEQENSLANMFLFTRGRNNNNMFSSKVDNPTSLSEFNKFQLSHYVKGKAFPYKLEEKLTGINSHFFQRNESLWDTLYANYLFESQKDSITNSSALLFENLLIAFLQSVEADSLVSIKDTKLSGLYLIYNVTSHWCYIGESKDIYKRLQQHYIDLFFGSHSNMNLQKVFVESDQNINILKFLIWDFGLPFENKEYRLKKEKELIEQWPGLLYNIVHNKE